MSRPKHILIGPKLDHFFASYMATMSHLSICFNYAERGFESLRAYRPALIDKDRPDGDIGNKTTITLTKSGDITSLSA